MKDRIRRLLVDNRFSDSVETDVDAYLQKQVDHTLYNLGLTQEFDFPLTLRPTDPSRIVDLEHEYFGGAVASAGGGTGTGTGAEPVTAGDVPAAASKRFSAGQGSGLTPEERKAIAQWMASYAQSRGFPPELPVMAALTETGDTLRNLVDGDRDSVGFFQIRVSIHGQKAVESPTAQMQWFLYNAARAPLGRTARNNNWDRKVFESQISAARAANDEGLLSLWLGRWCQDVERSAYPDRYEQRYLLARKLIYGQ